METKNVNGDILSQETFETKEELIKSFSAAMDDDNVYETKVIKMTDTRRKVVEKKMRKLRTKLDVYNNELAKG